MTPAVYKNFQSSSLARNFNKVIGLAPFVKEDEFKKLEDLILHEADLIKIGAFRQLNKMSNIATTDDKKKKFILAKLRATIELIKYYGVVWNCPMVKFTFVQGLYYAHGCQKLFKENPGQCLEKKMQLYTAFIFSHKIEVNRLTRLFLNKTSKEVERHMGKENKTLKYTDIKIACEVKLAQENKNILLKTAMKMFMGSSKNYDCATELLPFENDLTEIGSYSGEFHYLVARAYGHQKNYKLAVDHLRKARQTPVFDSKTRETNKKVQAYYEKMYTRLNANVK
ncbi:uncharacterized protein LOC111043016 [Myzus persicae]|uniref:uncharacterized protein LOC111043016 n=1 Tax=Myzus persicae TaxID=13164 RepID=UPI000B936CBF|nr:uncharacterized protein LOC111043016 [Myzus persicae]